MADSGRRWTVVLAVGVVVLLLATSTGFRAESEPRCGEPFWAAAEDLVLADSFILPQALLDVRVPYVVDVEVVDVVPAYFGTVRHTAGVIVEAHAIAPDDVLALLDVPSVEVGGPVVLQLRGWHPEVEVGETVSVALQEYRADVPGGAWTVPAMFDPSGARVDDSGDLALDLTALAGHLTTNCRDALAAFVSTQTTVPRGLDVLTLDRAELSDLERVALTRGRYGRDLAGAQERQQEVLRVRDVPPEQRRLPTHRGQVADDEVDLRLDGADLVRVTFEAEDTGNLHQFGLFLPGLGFLGPASDGVVAEGLALLDDMTGPPEVVAWTQYAPGRGIATAFRVDLDTRSVDLREPLTILVSGAGSGLTARVVP